MARRTPPLSAQLRPLQKSLIHVSTALLWLSGAAWLYLKQPDDIHPVQPFLMKLHGAAAILFLLVFGGLWVTHIPAGWQQNDRRPSGSWLTGVNAILIITGWGLYYMGGESARHFASFVHGAVGLVLPVLLVVHILAARRSSLP